MKILLSLLVAAVATVPATATPSDKPASEREYVRIPFPSSGGIRNYHAVSEEVLYLQDRRRDWYRADLVGPCIGLRGAIRIGFDTRGSSAFDRTSHILVGNQRCLIGELSRSGPPPKKRDRRRQG
jgi:hypothetical protein